MCGSNGSRSPIRPLDRRRDPKDPAQGALLGPARCGSRRHAPRTDPPSSSDRERRHSKCYGGLGQNVKGWSRMAGAFDHLRVLDLSWGMAGPMATMFLVDNGADVIRIEPPLGDPFAQQTGYRVWNRGKRSVRLDLHERSMAVGNSIDSSRNPTSWSTASRGGRRRGSASTTTPSARSIPASSPVRSLPTGSTPSTVTVPATTGSSLPGPASSMTKRVGGGQPWSSSMAVPGRTPSSTRPRGSSGVLIERVRSSRGPHGRASARPISPHWGSPPRCALEKSVVWAST